jgi:hypothetical protein
MPTTTTDLRTPGSTQLDAPRGPNPTFKHAITLLLGMMSLSVLGGCQVIKGIFGVGFGLGALIVVAVVAIIGGIVAMVSRK